MADNLGNLLHAPVHLFQVALDGVAEVLDVSELVVGLHSNPQLARVTEMMYDVVRVRGLWVAIYVDTPALQQLSVAFLARAGFTCPDASFL